MQPEPLEILISAGEASGDLYGSALVEALRRRLPDARFFGCAGTKMQAAGVEPVVDAASLSVVGLIEVVSHIPRIYGEFRRLIAAARARKPALAILVDSPDFHLRAAAKLHAVGIPVVYLVAPQAWAWRKGRVRAMRRNISRLLCIFPFEEAFFRGHGMPTDYIGHPLARICRPRMSRGDFFSTQGLDPDRPLLTLLPGSRAGEIARHLPVLAEASRRIAERIPAQFVLALPEGLTSRHGRAYFSEPISGAPIQLIEGHTWDAIAHADLALAASGTVTVEAAILGTPMVAYYKVSAASWWMGRFLVNVPFYTMVNLVAGKRVAPELMQNEMSAENLTREAVRLMQDEPARARMRADLAEVAQALATSRDPMDVAAELVEQELEKSRSSKEDAHVA